MRRPEGGEWIATALVVIVPILWTISINNAYNVQPTLIVSEDSKWHDAHTHMVKQYQDAHILAVPLTLALLLYFCLPYFRYVSDEWFERHKEWI